ncbi:hypothetical protein [Streptomyces sp. NPDC006638]|uniref:terpene synthase family protein n=1 Tax=Streptomyces sp. NPDC006638 TaxID=3157183 RepID=UPI0033A78B47
MNTRIAFDVPFPSRISPDLDDAVRHTYAWVRGTRLITTDASMAVFASWRPVELPARWYPESRGADLHLASDLLAWLMLFDDVFDGPPGKDVAHAQEVVRPLLAVLDGTREPASATAVAFDDLWRREREGMPHSWCRRADHNWREYLDSVIAEASNRQTRATLTVDRYLALRDRTGIMHVLLDAAERVGHYQVPPVVRASPELRSMYDSTVLVASVINDLVGLNKEETLGDPHNLVLVLEHSLGVSRHEAIGRTKTMLADWTHTYQRNEALIPATLDRLQVSTEEREATNQFIRDMRAAMKGAADWCQISERYSTHALAVSDPRDAETQ